MVLWWICVDNDPNRLCTWNLEMVVISRKTEGQKSHSKYKSTTVVTDTQ